MSLFISSLVGGKIKLLSPLVVTGVSASSVPIALTSKSTQQPQFLQHQEISTASQFLNERLTEASQKLKEEYDGKGKKIIDSAKNETIDQLTDQWHQGQQAATYTYDYIKENSQEINYYLLTLQNLWKSFMVMLPQVIRDSIVHNDETKLNQQLLSIQKMIAVSHKKEFKEFAQALIQVLQDHQSILKTLTMDDGSGIWKILREVREDDYDKFMKHIKDNAQKIKTKQPKEYHNATDLLKDLFVGGGMNELKNQGQQLKDLIESMKDKLQKIKGLNEENINKVVSALTQISDNKTN